MDCIFCKIANGEIPAKKVHETDDTVVFHDLSPQAPVHLLAIPKKHFDSLNEADDEIILGKLMTSAKEAAKKLNIDKGYRVVINTGETAGQSVFHIHAHVLGGRNLQWPPG